MRGKVDQSSLGIGAGGSQPVWRIRAEDGTVYECRPSRSQAEDVSSLMLSAGLKVDFDVERRPTGEVVVRITGWEGQSEWADGGVASEAEHVEELAPVSYGEYGDSQDSGDGRFVNPYNFVRFASRRADAPGLVAHVGFGPEDASLSGSVRVRLEALSPLLVPDSEGRAAIYEPERVAVPHGVTPGERRWYAQFKEEGSRRLLPIGEYLKLFPGDDEYEELELEAVSTPAGIRWQAIDVSEARGASRSTRFFRLGASPAIPLSTLRGVTRSLYEAATNSCLSQFDAEGQEGWRPNLDNDSDRDMYAGVDIEVLPGRVAVEPRGRGEGHLEVADGVHKVSIAQTLKPQLGRYDFRRAQGSGLNVHFTLSARGDVVDRISEKQFAGSQAGLLKESGRMPTKKHEYVVVFSDKPRRIKLTQKDVDQFLDVNKQGSLRPGRLRNQLVWMRVGRTSGRLLSFGRGYLHKVPCEAGGERSTYGKRLPSESYKSCDSVAHSADGLCPSCSLFGSVLGRGRSAYGGRVSFGTAHLKSDYTLEEVDLQPLGQPKPQTGFFYLRKADGSLADWNSPGSLLAGRKVYLHETELTPTHYLRRDFDHANQASSAEVLMPGATFEYEVRFKDLRDWELGALLWCLAPAAPRDSTRRLAIKVGGAKPLGLGSAAATIVPGSLAVDERTARYASFDAHLSARSTPVDPAVFTEKFYERLPALDGGEMKSGSGVPPWFEELTEALAYEPFPRAGEPLRVGYPARIARGGKLKGNPVVYEWFTWARKRRPGSPGGGMQLPTVLEMAEDRRQLEGWGE